MNHTQWQFVVFTTSAAQWQNRVAMGSIGTNTHLARQSQVLIHLAPVHLHQLVCFFAFPDFSPSESVMKSFVFAEHQTRISQVALPAAPQSQSSKHHRIPMLPAFAMLTGLIEHPSASGHWYDPKNAWLHVWSKKLTPGSAHIHGVSAYGWW